MVDIDRIIEPLLGPYARQHVSVSAVEAETAIAEGWARDPYDPAPVRDPAPEAREAMTVLAVNAARRWRGEADPDEPPDDESDAAGEEAGTQDDPSPSASGRDMTPGAPGRYQTRAVAPKEPAKRRR